MPKIISKRHRLAHPPPKPTDDDLLDDAEEWLSSGVVTNGAPIPCTDELTEVDDEVLRKTTQDVEFEIGNFDWSDLDFASEFRSRRARYRWLMRFYLGYSEAEIDEMLSGV